MNEFVMLVDTRHRTVEAIKIHVLPKLPKDDFTGADKS